jgi:kinesin family protein 18/19
MAGDGAYAGGVGTEDMERDMWAGSSNILVVTRCRPLSEKEKRTTDDVVNVVDGKIVVVRDPGHHANNIMRQKRIHDRKWAFDHAFGPECGQEHVYGMTTRHLIAGVAAG